MMATSESLDIVETDSGTITESDPMKAIHEKTEMRKNLNAYAIMAYVAISDRNAMAEQLKGLEHVNRAVGELQERLKEKEEEATNLQMEIWRNEAFVTRSRLQLRIKDNEITFLTDRLKEYQRISEVEEEEREETEEVKKSEDTKDSGQGEKSLEKDSEETEPKADQSAVEQSAERKHRDESPKLRKSNYLMGGAVQIGVSREVHEVIVQENLHLKRTLQQLIDKQGGSLKDLTDSIQYQEIIKQLKLKISEKESELAKILDTLKQADSPKEQIAKKLLDMEAKVRDAERVINMKQVMIEALSSRCDELSRALESSQEEKDLKMSYVRSSFTDGPSSEALSKSAAEKVLPSVEIKNLIKENSKLKKLNESQVAENELLRKERESAKRERNDLQRNLAAIKSVQFQPCVTCKDYKTRMEALQSQHSEVKDQMDVAMIQAEGYKSDFNDKCGEMVKQKASYEGDIMTWKRNCNALSMQMDQMRRELDKQVKMNSQLQAQSRFQNQEILQQRARYPYGVPGMPPASMPPSQRCGAHINPWQESTDYASMPSEVAVGRDECDLASTQHDSASSGTHQWTAVRPAPKSTKLACSHCQREFPISKQREFEDHQKRCFENS